MYNGELGSCCLLIAVFAALESIHPSLPRYIVCCSEISSEASSAHGRGQNNDTQEETNSETYTSTASSKSSSVSGGAGAKGHHRRKATIEANRWVKCVRSPFDRVHCGYVFIYYRNNMHSFFIVRTAKTQQHSLPGEHTPALSRICFFHHSHTSLQPINFWSQQRAHCPRAKRDRVVLMPRKHCVLQQATS